MEFFRLKNISLASMKCIRLSSSDDDDDVCCPVPMSLTLRLNFDSDFQAKNSEQKSCNVCFGSRKCYLYFRFRFDHRRWHHTPHNNNKQLRPRSVGLSCERLAASENKKCRQFFVEVRKKGSETKHIKIKFISFEVLSICFMPDV